MEEIKTDNKLTPQQRAIKKYYEKIKYDPLFIEKRKQRQREKRKNNPACIEKQRINSLKNNIGLKKKKVIYYYN